MPLWTGTGGVGGIDMIKKYGDLNRNDNTSSHVYPLCLLIDTREKEKKPGTYRNGYKCNLKSCVDESI